MKKLYSILIIFTLIACVPTSTPKTDNSSAEDVESQMSEATNTEQIKETEINLVATLFEHEDQLLKKGETSHVFQLAKGDTIHFIAEFESAATVQIITIQTKKVLATYNKKSLNERVSIPFSAPYKICLKTNSDQYATIQILRQAKDIKSLSNIKPLQADTVECKKGEDGAVPFKGISLVNIFKQPQKNTLSSYWKQLAGGKCRAVIPVVLPKGTTSWAYQLRISTSKQDLKTDGTLCKDMTEANRKIKIAGIPIYESHGKKTSLVREILNSFASPEREEDAFCSFYVFKSKVEAEKFTNLAEKWNCYREYSIEGTQSTQGEVPTNGQTTFYIGIQNTRATTAIYTWLDIVAAIPQTEYYKVEYK